MMPWSHWNAADKTLLLAAVLFLFGLCLKTAYPASIFAQGFLFVTEAALVGGVADWFAVTALFRKPLGFPYHTAILPRRRAEFVDAAIRLVESEFFTRKKLVAMADTYDWKSMLLGFAHGEDMRRRAAEFLYDKAAAFLMSVDFSGCSEELSDALRRELESLPVRELFPWLQAWLKEEGRAQRLLTEGARKLRTKADSEEMLRFLQEKTERFIDEKAAGTGILGNFFASLAKTTNVLNAEELSVIMQGEALRFLDEAADGESETAHRILEIFYQTLEKAADDEELVRAIAALRGRFLHALSLGRVIDSAFLLLQQGVKDALSEPDSELSHTLRTLIDQKTEKAWHLLEQDEHIGILLDSLVHDMAGRSALKAQKMSGVVVREVMERLTDAQLNSIIYGKVEPDLLWIRMNGSIVGALLGCILFALMTAVR